MDLSARLRSIVRPAPRVPAVEGAASGLRELTYEPDDGRRYEAVLDLERVSDMLGGRMLETDFGRCLAIDRRYEADRWHGDVQIGQCGVDDREGLTLLDPTLDLSRPIAGREAPDGTAARRPVFIDLETTGLSGGAGTVAFLVGCGYFDLDAFQVRQFLLTSYAAERALLAAVAEFFDGADLIVTYNGKTFDVPVMETRWVFHRMPMPLDGVPHFDMLHPARRLWRGRAPAAIDEGGCRLSALERTLLNLRRVGDVAGFEIPSRFFQFLRSGDPRPLEPVLEHNRLDIVSLAAVTGHAVRLARAGDGACRDEAEALALGRVLERAGAVDRAESCYRRASRSSSIEIRGEALYRLGLRYRRERRFEEAAAIWRDVMALTSPARYCRRPSMPELRQFAAEALAIHHEHRVRDLETARELTLFAIEEDGPVATRADDMRYRLARLDRKLAKRKNAQLFSS
jgi:tetratricopeptide (TPR) repeat protein